MTIFLECPECQNRIETWKAAKIPDGTLMKLCPKCDLRYAVLGDDLKAAEAAGQSIVTGTATQHQRRKAPVKQSTPAPEPKQAPQAPQAATAPKPSQPKEPAAEAPAKSSASAVYDDAKKRAAAAGQPVDEIAETNPLLRDAMKRARQ